MLFLIVVLERGWDERIFSNKHEGRGSSWGGGEKG